MKDDAVIMSEWKEKSRSRYGRPDKKTASNGFTCAHCHGFVYSKSGRSGVQNRNHCPYCLWSRHLDLYAAGDRLSACKASMRPVGLTVKSIRKKYGAGLGELMLIHSCEECKALSINRIAADDDPQKIFSIYADSFHLDLPTQVRLDARAIRALDLADRDTVLVRLFGYETGPVEMLFQNRTSEVR